MSARSIRRAAERKYQKAQRKAAMHQQTPAPQQTPEPNSAPTQPTAQTDFPEPGGPLPRFSQISEVRLAANRANAQKAHGAVTPAGRAASSQNRLLHGLARHNGKFALLATEDPAEYAAFLQSFLDEHQPTTPTELTLVHAMTESAWLRNRAQSLQPGCFDPTTGQLVNEKSLALFIRYETSYTRSFNATLNQLLKLRAEARKSHLGFEAQNLANEQHQMKKDHHYWDVLLKDAKTCHQLQLNTACRLDNMKQHPDFNAAFEAELKRHKLTTGFADAIIRNAA